MRPPRRQGSPFMVEPQLIPAHQLCCSVTVCGHRYSSFIMDARRFERRSDTPTLLARYVRAPLASGQTGVRLRVVTAAAALLIPYQGAGTFGDDATTANSPPTCETSRARSRYWFPMMAADPSYRGPRATVPRLMQPSGTPVGIRQVSIPAVTARGALARGLGLRSCRRNLSRPYSSVSFVCRIFRLR